MARLVFALPLVALAVLAGSAGAQSARGTLEVRFCGSQPLRTYSLSTEGNLQSVLLPYALVINRGNAAVDLTALELALVRETAAVDSRTLGRSELETFGKLSQQFEVVPDAKASLALLCGDHLVPKGVALGGLTGNHVMIDHGNGEYSLYAHLQPGSVRVSVGATVHAGDAIGKVGGSGNALVEPHLHFHVCDKPTPLACAGLPVMFESVEIPFVTFAPRPVQSGDIVIAK